MEIERKYLPLDLPRDLESYPHKRLTQGYISRDPVIRVRSIETLDGSGQEDRYVLTVKSSGLAVRQEYELDLTRSQFDSLSEKVEGHLISKVRYVIP
ncbi:MAG TPA: adenylate cyclase, partial [Lachnospiraceae bacterium]|nr:adenylate cyclase [Lachnospiraceae bacterium]